MHFNTSQLLLVPFLNSLRQEDRMRSQEIPRQGRMDEVKDKDNNPVMQITLKPDFDYFIIFCWRGRKKKPWSDQFRHMKPLIVTAEGFGSPVNSLHFSTYAGR
jgi:hypothetical protein